MDMSSPQHTRRRAAPVVLLCALAAATTVSGTVHPRGPSAADRPTTGGPPLAALLAVIPAPPPAAPKPPGPRHDYVAPAVPTSMTFQARGFSIKAHVCEMPAVFPLDPPGEQHHTVCLVGKGFGYRPGSHTATSYILGHSWAPDPQEVLNKISERATRELLHEHAARLDGVPVYPITAMDGARLTLHTPTGTLVYSVRSGYAVDKTQFGLVKRTVDQHVRNRVILVTCSEGGGHDYYFNIVLDTRLVSSISAATTAAERAHPAVGIEHQP